MHDAALALDLELQVNALPTSLVAAVGPPYAQRFVMLRLEPGIIDLRRLALLKVVNERILARSIAPAAALVEVERIASLGHALNPFLTVASYCLLSVGVSIVLGGREHENAASAAIGISCGLLAVLSRRIPAIDRLFEVLCALLATVIVTEYAVHVHPLIVYVPLVAGVVQTLPGFQLTTALHELAYRNFVAGTSRLGSVLMTLLSLGCGFALGIAIVGPQALHLTTMNHGPTPRYELVLAVLAVGCAIAVLENARLIDYPWVLASCAVAEVAYRLFAASPGYQVSTFGAAFVVGLLTSAGSRFARVPQSVLLIPGMLILVPGSLSYESILFVLQNESTDAAGIALNAVIASVEIVAGLLLAQLLFAPTRRPNAAPGPAGMV
jgi:uncharacterized membrane protein YjjB (DUF3815 family)